MSESPNRILEFLTNPARPEGDACRSNPRRPSSAHVELSWADLGGWRTIRGRLRDISRAGAGLVAAVPPPSGTRARLRLSDGEGSPWIEAEVLGVEAVNRRRNRVRLRFLEPCPGFLLRMAVLGPEEEETGRPAPRFEWPAWRPARSD